MGENNQLFVRINHFFNTVIYRYIFLFLFVALCLFGNSASAQGKLGEGQIALIQSEIFEFKNGLRYIKPSPNKKVIFMRDSTYMYCNLAIQNPTNKNVEAFGDVVIEEREGALLTGDTLYYNNTTNMAEMRGNVVLIDSTTTLYSNELFYNLTTRNAYYISGGKVIENGSILTSKKGNYYSASQALTFKGDVVLRDTVKNQDLYTDTLTYFTPTKDAFFHTTTRIETEDGNLIAERGTYNTNTGITNFEGQAEMDSEDYLLKGDRMFSDRNKDLNIVKGNVYLFSKEENAEVFGDDLIYRENYGNSKVFASDGKYAVMKRPFGDSDSLFLAADTLLTINDTINNIRQLHAYYNVKLLSEQLLGKCDSLIYDYNDSTITMFNDPILWNAEQQIKADHIQAFISNSQVDSLVCTDNSFVIQKDTLGNFNQIKGRTLVAWFKNNDIDRLDVNGNCQSIYFAVEADTLTMGMNKVDCSSMVMYFSDSSKLERMSFKKTVDAKFIPPHEIEEPETRLKGFRLRFDEKPPKNIFITRNKIAIVTEESDIKEEVQDLPQIIDQEQRIELEKKLPIPKDSVINQKEKKE
ncbi:MAG: OstA-like protein [Bacteroidota bacterium]